jgi:hypothetical protein
LWCRAGLYAAGTGNDHCINCPTGYLRTDIEPPPGYVSGCIRCINGTRSLPGQSVCTKCLPGQYANALNDDPSTCIGEFSIFVVLFCWCCCWC